MEEMTEYDIKLLRHLNGEDVPELIWGAAMSVSIEFLSGSGYATRPPNYKITEKGRAFLESLK